jgi:uncharacterized membrane protein YgcG
MHGMIQCVMTVMPPARWQRHGRKMTTAAWNALRCRREEVLTDVALVTWATIFQRVVALDGGMRGVRERLSTYFIQIYVNLLRAAGPEHDAATVSKAVGIMVPLLPHYAPSAGSGSGVVSGAGSGGGGSVAGGDAASAGASGGGGGSGGGGSGSGGANVNAAPVWVNYVRKFMLELTESGTSQGAPLLATACCASSPAAPAI